MGCMCRWQVTRQLGQPASIALPPPDDSGPGAGADPGSAAAASGSSTAKRLGEYSAVAAVQFADDVDDDCDSFGVPTPLANRVLHPPSQYHRERPRDHEPMSGGSGGGDGGGGEQMQPSSSSSSSDYSEYPPGLPSPGSPRGVATTRSSSSRQQGGGQGQSGMMGMGRRGSTTMVVESEEAT